MAIYYVDFLSGSNVTGNGTAGNPYKTMNYIDGLAGTHEIRIASTTVATTTAVNAVFTYNTNTITTSGDMRTYIVVGDYIGKPTAAGNGSHETYYKVESISVSSITLEQKYYGTTETVSAIKMVPIIQCDTVQTDLDYVYKISGGWNLGTESQDGESWFKDSASRSSEHYIIINRTSCDISKINIVDGWCGIVLVGTPTVNINNVTAHMYNYCVGNYSTQTGTSTVQDCCFSAYNRSAGYVYNPNYATNSTIIRTLLMNGYYNILKYGWTTTITMTDCIFFNAANAVISCNYVTLICTGTNKAYYTTFGIINQPVWAGVLENFEFYNVSYPLNQSQQEYRPIVRNCRFENAILGFGTVYNTTLYSGSYISNCYFKSCTTGINVLRHGDIIDNCVFDGCTTCINIEAAGGSTDIMGCDFKSIGTVGVNRVIGSGIVNISNCTIDDASLLKAYVVVIALTMGPHFRQYVIDNSFGYSGTIWTGGSKMTSSTVYRTTGPSLAITWNATTTNSQIPMKIMSTMVNAGSSATFNMYLKSGSASWAGNLRPQWRLNGIILKTESTVVSSLSTDWQPFSWSTSGFPITANGELSLHFIPNMNTYPIYLDDFGVTFT